MRDVFTEAVYMERPGFDVVEPRTEIDRLPLRDAGDWWRIVLGSGLRRQRPRSTKRKPHASERRVSGSSANEASATWSSTRTTRSHRGRKTPPSSGTDGVRVHIGFSEREKIPDRTGEGPPGSLFQRAFRGGRREGAVSPVCYKERSRPPPQVSPGLRGSVGIGAGGTQSVQERRRRWRRGKWVVIALGVLVALASAQA